MYMCYHHNHHNDSNDDNGKSALPPLWPVFVLLGVVGLPASAFLWRKSRHDKRLRSFLQKDSNAGVLAVCRYALSMLLYAGAPVYNAEVSPLEYSL